MSTFHQTIKNAYESGDLNDRQILQQAMMYLNYLNAPDKVICALHDHTGWGDLDAGVASPGYNRINTEDFPVFADDRFCTSGFPLRHVTKAERYLGIKNRELPRSVKVRLYDTDLMAQERVDLFNRYVLPSIQAKKRVWLYQAEQADQELVGLLYDLGLYHYGKVGDQDEMLRFEFEHTKCRKPHWADADMAFYFYQTDDSQTHGWTMSLRTGKTTYPELLYDGDMKQLKLVDVWLEKPESKCNLLSPNPVYWEMQKKRVKEAKS